MNTAPDKVLPASPTAGYDQYPPACRLRCGSEPGEREQRHVSDGVLVAGRINASRHHQIAINFAAPSVRRPSRLPGKPASYTMHL